MAGFGGGYGSGGWGTSNYGAFYGIASTEPVVNSSGGGSSGTIGLPSPQGDKIPQGIGTFPVYGQLIVDPDLLGGVTQSDTTTNVNLVLAFAETTLGGPVSLINLKANDKYIYRTETPTKPFPGTIRFYGGDQAALDPLLSTKLTNPTYWPRLAYAVLEGFDIAPYDNQLPSFQAELSTGASASVLSASEATINFGAFHDGSDSRGNAIDRLRNHFYNSDYDYGTNSLYILTIDVITNQEINRAKVSWSGGTFDLVDYWVSLDGSDFIVGSLLDNADSKFKLCLIDTVTGTVEAVLANLSQSGTTFEPNPIRAQLITSGAATKYLVYSDALATAADANSALMVTVADITAGTLTNIAHQFSSPVAASGSGELWSVCPGPSGDGQAVMFFISSVGTNDNNVWKAVFSEAGIVSVAIAHTGTDCRDVAYDPTDDTIVVYDATGTLKKVDSLGSVLYTVATGITGLRINYSHYETGGQFNFKTRDGFAAGEVVFGSHDVYLIDLSDGSTSLVIAGANYYNGYVYYDQTKGYLTTDSLDLTISGMRRYTLPLSTVPTYDLQNIYTKLAEYRGKFSSGDLEFDGFTGGECYGVVYNSDTTLDNAEQDANNVFDVKIVPSDGKRKYVKAKRDGSFALGDTIPDDAIVEQADFNIRKTMASDEQSLVGARISYIDKNARFERTEQEYRRPVGIYSVTRSDRVEDVSTNFVLSSTQAMQAVTTKVYRSNFGLDAYTFTLAPEKFCLEPSDIVQFDYAGFTIVGQINDGNLSGELFTQDLTVTQYVQAIDASFTGSDVNLPDIADQSWLTRFLYLDAPLLSLGDDLGGAGVRQYAMMSGYGYGAFQGATLYRSYDGNTYGVLTSRYGVSPVVGLLKAIAGTPDATIEAIDASTTIEVSVLSGDTDDLQTITEAQMLAGGNKALVGKPGRWVIVYFQTVSVSDKTATLSGIVWSSPFYQTFLDSLTVGDYFVFLQPGHHVRFSGEVDRLGDAIYYKAASDAFPITAVPTENQTLVGRAEMPFPPLHLTALLSGSDIELGWDWRSRLNATILPGSDNNPAGEATLAFEIEIMDGATVKRTLTATTNTKTYLAADIATDWGSTPTELTFRVYQMSALVGRGYVSEATVDVGVVSAVGSAAGTSSASAVGSSSYGSVGSAVGAGSAAAVGESTFAASGSSDGVASGSAVGASTSEAVGSAAGTSTTDGVAQMQGEGVGTAAGTSTASAIGASTAAATASTSGAGAAAATGSSTVSATASASGTATASAISDVTIQLTYLAGYTSTANGNPSFTGVTFGDAPAAGHTRHILVVRGRTSTGVSSQPAATAVTIGGQTASLVVAQSGGFRCAEAWIAEVPTGTSGTVSWTSGGNRHGMAVYRIDDIPNVSWISTASSNTSSAASLTVAVGEAVVGVSADIGSGAQSMSGVNEDYNVSAGTSHRMIAGHLAVTSAGTVDVQTSSTGNRSVAALVIRTSAP